MNAKRITEREKKFSRVKGLMKNVKQTTSTILQGLKENIPKRQQNKTPNNTNSTKNVIFLLSFHFW